MVVQNKKVGKGRKMLDITERINYTKAINLMVRRINKYFYWNKECYAVVLGGEMKTLNRVLRVLYQNYLTQKNAGVTEIKKMKWLKQEEVFTLSKGNQPAITAALWKLIPVFVHVHGKTRLGIKRKARYFSLNKYGVEMVEKMMEENKDV